MTKRSTPIVDIQFMIIAVGLVLIVAGLVLTAGLLITRPCKVSETIGPDGFSALITSCAGTEGHYIRAKTCPYGWELLDGQYVFRCRPGK